MEIGNGKSEICSNIYINLGKSHTTSMCTMQLIIFFIFRAMLSVVVTILCFVCYCCHRNLKKRSDVIYRQRWLEVDPNMDIYSVEQVKDLKIFISEWLPLKRPESGDSTFEKNRFEFGSQKNKKVRVRGFISFCQKRFSSGFLWKNSG